MYIEYKFGNLIHDRLSLYHLSKNNSDFTIAYNMDFSLLFSLADITYATLLLGAVTYTLQVQYYYSITAAYSLI
jgi:hypothetical protein